MEDCSVVVRSGDGHQGDIDTDIAPPGGHTEPICENCLVI